MLNNYLHSKSRKQLGHWFNKQFHYSDHIFSPRIPKTVYIMQDIYPLGYQSAHILLWTKEEKRSIAVSTGKQLSSVVTALRRTVSYLHKLYPDKDIIFFEHGAGVIHKRKISCGGCHIDHAHMHIVVLSCGTPVLAETILSSALAKSGWPNPLRYKKHLRSLDDLGKAVKLLPYILFGYLNKNEMLRYHLYIQKQSSWVIESQIMRRVLGILYGHPESSFWHWEDAVSGYSKEYVLLRKRDIGIFRKKIHAAMV